LILHYIPQNTHQTHFSFLNNGLEGSRTQEQLAQKVGVRRETIGYLEKGNYNPSLKLAAKVARVLNSTIEELFIFEDFDLR